MKNIGSDDKKISKNRSVENKNSQKWHKITKAYIHQ